MRIGEISAELNEGEGGKTELKTEHRDGADVQQNIGFVSNMYYGHLIVRKTVRLYLLHWALLAPRVIILPCRSLKYSHNNHALVAPMPSSSVGTEGNNARPGPDVLPTSRLQ
jgi:hypothetical protein